MTQQMSLDLSGIHANIFYKFHSLTPAKTQLSFWLKTCLLCENKVSLNNFFKKNLLIKNKNL